MSKMLYNSLVLPLFDYCDVVIGKLNKTNLRRLQNLQNRGARIILKADSRTHINDMMSDVEQRHKLHTSVMVYKVMNRPSTKYFTELSDKSITCGNTRGLLEIPNSQVSLCRIYCRMWTNIKSLKFAPILLRRRVNFFLQLGTVLSQ